MRLKNIPGSREAVSASKYVIPEEEMEHLRGHWQEVFRSTNPLYLEVGMGKGQFLTQMAAAFPERSFLGIEKYSSVLIRALEKRPDNLHNLLYLRMDAQNLPNVFSPGEVDGIYLNFSDPWPKDRHAKRRLPGREFLARYEQILKPEGQVEFKTDNQDLFAFALAEAKECGWIIEDVTYDLHHDERMLEGNVMTEYEERFAARGNPILKMIIRLPSRP